MTHELFVWFAIGIGDMSFHVFFFPRIFNVKGICYINRTPNKYTKYGIEYHLIFTCDEVFSWMTEIWMKNHLVSGRNCNIVHL
jgi:hypothetical protein